MADYIVKHVGHLYRAKAKRNRNTMFDLTKAEYEKICEELMLNEEYQKLLEMKIKGYSRTKMAMQLGISEPTLDIMIRKLKKKIRKII